MIFNPDNKTLDNQRFFVEYSDGQNRWEPFVLYFNISENSIAKFWKECLLKNYLGDTESNTYLLDKRYMQRGCGNNWCSSSSRTIEDICKEMNHAIKIINENLNPVGYPYIDLEFTLEKVKDSDVYRDIMNQIHHHFELLIGQVWDISEWYKNTDEKTRWAIHQINNYCHEIESAVDAMVEFAANIVKQGAKNNDPEQYSHIVLNTAYGQTGINFCCNQSRDGVHREPFTYYELTEEHYKDFSPVTYGWGTLVPYYSQLGKTPREAFDDKDEYIDKKNISSTCLMTGEVNIVLGGPGPGQGVIHPTLLEGPELEFKNWLEANGWDYYDPKLAIGTAIIGMVDFSVYPDQSWEDLDYLVKRCDNVTAIGFVDENMNIVKGQRYDYTWQQQYQMELDYFNLNHPHVEET